MAIGPSPSQAFDARSARPVVRRPCDVCGGEDFERLATLRSPRLPGLALPVGICRRCGFVTQYPRLPSDQYRAVNSIWFSHMFGKDAPNISDQATKFGKWELMWQRIGRYYPAGPAALLDVGAGQGWAIEFLRSRYPAMPATAIEQWGPCQDYIRNQLGAEVVDVDITDAWPAGLAGRFDLVIFRHTIEHLEEPLAALERVATALAPGGHCYLVAPNALSITPGNAMATNYFRPVHLHYFNAETLTALAARAGLAATVVDGGGGEVWGLYRRREANDLPAVVPDTFLRQRNYLLTRLADARVEDWRRKLRIWVSGMLPDVVRRLRRGRLAGGGRP